MAFHPVLQGQFILSKLAEHFRFLVAGAQLLLHIRHDFRNTGIAFMLQEGFIEIQFGVFFNLNAQVVQLLDRSVTCEEVHRSRAEGYDLQVLQRVYDSGDRQELMDHVRTFFRITDRIFRNIGLYIAKLKVVAGVQHTAVSIAAVGTQNSIVLFRSCHEHLRSVKMLCQKSLGDFRSEVAEEYAQGVAAGLLNIRQRVDHIDFALDNRDGALINIGRIILGSIRFYKGFPPRLCEAGRETVTADTNDTDFDFWNVVHSSFLSLLKMLINDPLLQPVALTQR